MRDLHLPRWKFIVRELSHFQLLVMLIAVLVLQSFLDGNARVERIIVNFSLFALALSGIRSLSHSRWRTQAAVGLGVCGLVFSMLTATSFPSQSQLGQWRRWKP